MDWPCLPISAERLTRLVRFAMHRPLNAVKIGTVRYSGNVLFAHT